MIRHEAGHILGFLDHGGAELARYASWTKTIYDYYGTECAYNDPMNHKQYLRWKSTDHYIYEYVTPSSGLNKITLEYHENGTGYYYKCGSVGMFYNYETQEMEYYLHETYYSEENHVYKCYRSASGYQAVTIDIRGGGVPDRHAPAVGTGNSRIF